MRKLATNDKSVVWEVQEEEEPTGEPAEVECGDEQQLVPGRLQRRRSSVCLKAYSRLSMNAMEEVKARRQLFALRLPAP